MQHYSRWLAAVIVTALVSAGCRSSNSSANAEVEKPAEAAKPALPIPPDSPLAKIKVGMGTKQVFDLIGMPTDQNTNITGKQFNPFYFGGDTHRTVSHYKGIGRITFSRDHAFTSDMRVIEIEYDPTESGYR